MRRCVAACCLLLLLAAGGAQATVTLPVPWKEGMQLRYRSQSSNQKVKGKLHTRIQTQDSIELRILEAGPEGFVQQWRSVSPEVAVTGDGDQVATERKVAQALVARIQAGVAPARAQLDVDPISML